MVAITYPNDEFLAPDAVTEKIDRFARGKFLGFDFCRYVELKGNESVEWLQEVSAPLGDAKALSALKEITDGGEFPEITFELYEHKTAVTKMYGLQMTFTRNIRRNTLLVNMINDGMERAATWLAKLMNDLIFNSLTNSWSVTASTETNDEPWNQAAAYVWSDTTNRTPLVDQDGITLKINDNSYWDNDVDTAYVRKDNFQELQNYLQTTGSVYWTVDPTTGGWNAMLNNVKYIQVSKTSGIPASTALYFRMGDTPTTCYFKNDMAMEGSTGDYTTSPIINNDGDAIPGKWHVYRYFDDKNHNAVVQIWFEMYPVTTRKNRKTIGILRTL